MERCVIVGGAGIKNYAYIRSCLRGDDFVVFCDSGLKHLEQLRVEPSLIIGDFDSYEGRRPDVETIILPREKDDTDTMAAVKEAVRRGYDEFLLIGTVGERLDHTLGNVYILVYLERLGKKAVMADDYSEMEIVSGGPAFIDDSFRYFSLISRAGKASGIGIENAKYPLDNAEIDSGFQYGISNEVLPGTTAKVTVSEGELLLIKIR